MYYNQLLSKKLADNRKMLSFIRDYYKEKLMMELPKLTDCLKKLQGQVDGHVLTLCTSAVQALGKLRSSNKQLQLEGMRLNWYRASAILSRAGSHLQKKEAMELTRIMNYIVQCSRYYDNLPKEIERCGGLSELWFYKKHLAGFFNSILRVFKAPESFIQVQRSQCRFLMVFLNVFEQAMHNVHKQNPHEREQIGKDAVSKAEAYLKSAASFVKDCCANIVMGFSGLAQQLSAVEVAMKLKRAPNKRDQNDPGSESLIQNEHMVSALRDKMHAMGDVCAAFRETEKLIVFDQEMYPNAYLYDELVDFFRQQV
eukprot:UN30371